MIVVICVDFLIIRKGVRKGEELKAPRYASAALTRDYITTRDIIPNNSYILFLFISTIVSIPKTTIN